MAAGKTVTGIELTVYAHRLPKFPSTGNYATDSEAEGNHRNLKEIISACQTNPTVITSLHGHLRKVLSSMDCARGEGREVREGNCGWPPGGVLGCLGDLEVQVHSG